MSIRLTLRGILAALAALLLMTGCAPAPHEALEPLRGPGMDEAEVGSVTEQASAPELDANGVPLDMGTDAPAGFGQIPFDEMELPPDVPPPPVEGGAPPPDPGAAPPPPPPAPETPAPDPGSNPPGNTPLPPGGSEGVAAASDYCGLWREYGTVMGAVESALASGSAAQITAALTLAGQVHDRAADLDAGVAADHRRVASAMRALDALLGSYGHDLGRLLAAVESDPAVAARFAATQVDDSLERASEQILDQCGVSLF